MNRYSHGTSFGRTIIFAINSNFSAKENNFHVASVTSRLTAQFTTEYDLQLVSLLNTFLPTQQTPHPHPANC